MDHDTKSTMTYDVPDALFADYEADGHVDEAAIAAYDETQEAHWR